MKGHEEKKNTPITDHGKKMVRDKKNACVAVKRGVRVRRNCNVFNLVMENALKGLPDKIRDQLSRHHTNPAGTPGNRNGIESFFGLKGRPSVVQDV